MQLELVKGFIQLKAPRRVRRHHRNGGTPVTFEALRHVFGTIERPVRAFCAAEDITSDEKAASDHLLNPRAQPIGATHADRWRNPRWPGPKKAQKALKELVESNSATIPRRSLPFEVILKECA
jgi:hypothetical protein